MTLELLIQWAVLPALGLAFGLTVLRLLRGPSAEDRVIALDTLAIIGIGMAATLAILNGQPELGDEVLVIALVAFLGTLAYARYLERSA